jgi:hypothetical protein
MKFGFTGTPSRSPVALERALAQFDFAFHFLDLLGKRDGLGYATELQATHEQPEWVARLLTPEVCFLELTTAPHRIDLHLSMICRVMASAQRVPRDLREG